MTQILHERRATEMPVMKITENGQITIPKKIRDELGLKKGDLVEAERKDNQILITPKKLGGKAFQKVLAVMDRVNEKNKGVSEETVIEYATQAIAELRAEEYAKSQKS